MRLGVASQARWWARSQTEMVHSESRTRMIPMPAPGHSSHTLTHLLPSHIIISSTEPGVTNVKITCHHHSMAHASVWSQVWCQDPGPRPGNSCIRPMLRTLSPRNPDDSPIVEIAGRSIVNYLFSNIVISSKILFFGHEAHIYCFSKSKYTEVF